jgi:poly-gamma-glutamate capsule biosynthesis protein CapA/YwtB (metallophosphatase superfamily)
MPQLRTAAALAAALGLAACSISQAREPLRDPAPKEARALEKPEVPEQEPGVSQFTIFLAGDVLPGKRLSKRIKKFGPDYPFANLKDRIESCDLAFANLEAAISTRGEPVWIKKHLLRASPEDGRSLAFSGLDIVSLANNHAMDYGEPAFLDTLDALSAMDISVVGGGRNSAEASAPWETTLAGTRVAFLAYSVWTSSLIEADQDRAGINPFVQEAAEKQIRGLKSLGRVVIVSMHWGMEHTQVPTAQQVRMAHALIDAGADAVAGHHPHCPQSVEVYKGKPVFYSLGNFVFGLNNLDAVHNLSAILAFEGGRLSGARLLPVHGLGFVNRFSPWFLEGEAAAEAVRDIEKLSEKFGTKITVDPDGAFLDL